ncbi:type VI secretion system Vgr family protein [Maridesulfovibrio salexigens]|uniref:Rhs element Vgr protein n=1 Tax=Maridesulfovibrio salexigens (strain ATCC 14822 / DSM 2638 / NCIMB 8403 / VKM B-1763) TaxID=526222 RepID=C6BX12_MARSD|nr:type VI secretion system tip protein TssI/VgrG [Maridesulfovibrio salexigens]ACS78492.1 Rhs element Vgr protein [Maridesulfovibrio salexigens DSM 2638]
MADTSKPKFVFESKGADKNTFSVVRFKGTEGLSTIYRFSIMLISEKNDLDIGSILQNPAEFTIKRDDGDIPFKGMLSSFEQLHQAGKICFYRAELVPKLWWATLTHCNQIFLNENAQGFLGDVLKKAGLKEGLNFDFKLQGSYPSWEYICQYDESHFNFVSRWMERDGMYYYFEQTDQGEKMVITDTHISHSPMKEGTSLTYSPPSNLDHTHREEIVKNFMLKQQPLPKKVLLKDYNYRKPSLEMKAEALVSQQGMGEIYIYGEHFKTPGEGNTLAQIRAQEFLCREKVFHGVSTVPYIRTGYIFELKDHYRQDFNQRYLTTEVVHEGSQEAYLVSGLGLNLAEDADRLYYRNSFTCIPANTQFRAERKAVKPKFAGTINAKVDASGSGQYAELDGEGRYKVIMPFDESGRSGGKATTWLRMAQPYGGSNHGMHFPLHKGTEVLITCVEGDPDRPIIQSAAPNPENPSMVKDANQTKCIIVTGGQNLFHIQDKQGSEGMHLKTPKDNTYVRLGSAAAEPAGSSSSMTEEKVKQIADEQIEAKKKEESLALSTEGNIKINGKNIASYILGNESKVVVGFSQLVNIGNDTKFFGALKEDIVVGMETGIKLALLNEITATKNGLVAGTALKAETEREELIADHHRMNIDMTKLNATCAEINGDLSTIREAHTNLAMDFDDLKGATAELAGESSKLAGEVENLGGQLTEVAGDVSEVCGELTKIAGSKTKVSGEVIKACGDKTSAVAAFSQVSAESSQISGEMNNIAGLISNI